MTEEKVQVSNDPGNLNDWSFTAAIVIALYLDVFLRDEKLFD
jgi:hypothetical protein